MTTPANPCATEAREHCEACDDTHIVAAVPQHPCAECATEARE